ncbi:Exonuclease mut-7 [Phytophthora boehmeriae]|uniref:Exonuclease mut-7 n=1 Tax=Phytophthora boehmeriae TaxID=109152 RepID=A0A8T1XB95_9STRA|nr:Exonuclease mut-7 [Phytophthora boehmeriae]
MATRWEEDDVAGPLVRQLLQSDACSWETRAFLKPIFRWMKMGLHKDGSRDDEAIERAFAFVEWLVLLSTEGDAGRKIPKLALLQPSYALNTIVTASQRAGSVREAQRAFDQLIAHGYEPDVFTYTALIDVIARNGDLPAAIQKYEEMRSSKSKPNVVTYTTLIRAVGASESVPAEQCLEFLTHAREGHAFDEALFLEALETCARRKDRVVARLVLQEIALHSPKLRKDERLYHMVAQVSKLLDDRCKKSVLEEWVECGELNLEERDRIEAMQKQEEGAARDGSKTLGCLGHQTSHSVRKAVVHHDINRLIARIQGGSIVNVSDFETLIHQCRKRKWKEDVAVVVNAMRDLAANGWKPSSDDDDGDAIPPQPHLQPTSKTYVSIVDAYMCCGDEPLAWETLQEIEALPGIVRELPLFRKFIRGAYLLTNCDHVTELIALAQKDNIKFTQRMGVEVARMFGYQHDKGFELIVQEFPVAEPGVQAKKQAFLEELVKSCAYKKNLLGAQETVESMLKHGFDRSAATEIALFMCCIQHDTLSEAQTMLQHYQERELMLPVPVYDSLLREFYFKYTRRGNTFDESSRKVAMKTLYARRALFQQMFKDREALESNMGSSWAIRSERQGLIGSGDSDAMAFEFWCSREHVACSPLMFAQHAVQVLTTSRDKESKNAAEQAIRDALMITSDPCLFLLKAVVALRFLDLTFRALGKLAKQLLLVVTDELPMEKKHAEYCVTQLPLLSVHIVKELDDVVYLHQSHCSELLAFCLEAFENDSIDKTLGFLMRRQELYNLDAATYLGPKLAELFVFDGVANVLQFFKADTEDSLEMSRVFVREVIELENATAEEDGDDTSCTFRHTSKAIREFKLEHESEFMPYMLQALAARPKPIYADATAEPMDDTEYLKISLAPDHIVVVANDEALSLASETLMHDNVKRLGLDAEWRPDSRGTVPSKCSILQVACQEYVFIFDLVEMAIGDLEELFAHLFSSESIAKLGFGLDGDIKRLRWSFPEAQCFDTFANVIDFSFEELEPTTHLADGSIVKSNNNGLTEAHTRRNRRQKGLSACVKQVLGYPLSKLQQKSDWERRPLTSQQVSYAALDAYCLLMLQDALASA